jgi:hypothetical protein
MVETAAGRLDVGLRSLKLRPAPVMGDGIEAGKTGTGGQKHRQQDESLGPEPSCGPDPSREKHG